MTRSASVSVEGKIFLPASGVFRPVAGPESATFGVTPTVPFTRPLHSTTVFWDSHPENGAQEGRISGFNASNENLVVPGRNGVKECARN